MTAPPPALHVRWLAPTTLLQRDPAAQGRKSLAADEERQHAQCMGDVRVQERCLVAVQALLAIGAVYGAAGLVLQLDGFDLPTAWLDPLPLSSWVLPGIALFGGIALPLAVAAVAGWLHDRRAERLAWISTGLLLGWLALQLVVIGLRAPIQVVTLLLALLLLVLTATTSPVARTSGR